MSYIEFKDVVKKYQMGEVSTTALNKVNFEIEKGELVVICGASGARKNNSIKSFRRNGHNNRRRNYCR